ncbi:DUF6296 family protein [Kitasatospora sp. NPDC057965]|uniref:DUF6296 family protein n=1 Tax=Kitasatospora sp. NPDC057965 TaxID=3346291 RepID=UPI0036DD4149
MRLFHRYAIALPGPLGGHARSRTVIVHRTDRVGPAHEPVFEDVTGCFRFEISGAVARVLDLPAEYGRMHPCLEAVPMP